MNHLQIKPVLHYSVCLMFQQDVEAFRKQKKHLARVLRVSDKRPSLFDQIPFEKIKRSSDIIKIVRTMKSLKTIRLQESQSMTNQSKDPSRMRLIAEKVRRAESLSIKDVPRKDLPLGLEIYLRNTKKLKKIDLYLEDLSSKHDLEKKIKRLFGWMNRLKIKGLNITGRIKEPNKAPYLFQRYPSSLEKLSLSCYTDVPLVIDEPTKISLNNLTQLKALSFRINDATSPMIHLLNSFTDLSRLMTLGLIIDDPNNDVIDLITPFINTLRQAKNLKSLHLSFLSADAQKSFEKLFDAVAGCDLTELSWTGFPDDPVLWNGLDPFMSSLQHLESFKLIVPNSHSGSTNLFKIIKQYLAKSVRLSSLILECSSLDDSLHIEEVIDVLVDIAPRLRTLRIFMNPYEPSQPQFAKMMKFLHSLKEIRCLDLPTVNICELEQFEEIVNWCCSVKSLNSLQLGIIQCGKAQMEFLELVKRVILKRGIESFFCRPSNDLTDDMLIQMKRNADKEMKQIRQKNPFLENYPEFLRRRIKIRFDASSYYRGPY